MSKLEELKQCYDNYIALTLKLLKKEKPAEGLLGFGSITKNHPGHEEFFDEVGELVAALIEEGPDEETANAAAELIIHAPDDNRQNDLAYWFLYAAQKHCGGLIPLLSPAHCRALADFYDAKYPKLDRMPVQKKVYKLLVKYSKK